MSWTKKIIKQYKKVGKDARKVKRKLGLQSRAQNAVEQKSNLRQEWERHKPKWIEFLLKTPACKMLETV